MAHKCLRDKNIYMYCQPIMYTFVHVHTYIHNFIYYSLWYYNNANAEKMFICVPISVFSLSGSSTQLNINIYVN